jgi:phosphoenolpyruvate synthase/pyruvate phosphate dikinase
MMPGYIRFFAELDRDSLPLVGGKGANLGELARCVPDRVPEGFCVTTDAFRAMLEASPEWPQFLAELERLGPEDLEAIPPLGRSLRGHIEGRPLPERLMEEMTGAWERLGREEAYAVRSSATAEDLPQASFAGQQDTYLNVMGLDDLARRVRQCWASLFTDRAISYRIKNRFPHGKVWLAVVVQRMIFPEVSGIMFTADPVNGNRNVVSIDAGFGLGEALVSGKVTADLYKAREGRILEKQIAAKKLAIWARPGGGTEERPLPEAEQTRPALSDEQILELAGIGKAIERHFEAAQDIEWCLTGAGRFYIVQSRPITTLYPLPDPADDRSHLWLSFGHVQMMTDPVKPLGISILKRIAPGYEMMAGGGRLYFDIAAYLSSRVGRKMALSFGKTDQLMNSAIEAVLKRPEFIGTLKPGKRQSYGQLKKMALPLLVGTLEQLASGAPGDSLPELRQSAESWTAEIADRLRRLSGAARLEFVAANVSDFYNKLMGMVGPVTAAFIALNLIGRLAKRWLGDTAVDDLTKSPPGNITTEMGLALGDLADVIRQYPAVVAYLQGAGASAAAFWTGLDRVEGGAAVRSAFEEFLKKYGMRCPGEIDITRPRWRENPVQMIPAILSHIQSLEPGEHRRRFAAGEAAAGRAAAALLSRLERERGGRVKAKIMARLIAVYRGLIGFREYPKYIMITIFGLYKEAILEEAAGLVRAGALKRVEDAYYLSLEELTEVVRTGRVDYQVIGERQAKYERYEKLTPPRLMTGEGEILTGSYGDQGAPAGALPGIPVSAGVIEGRARVIVRPEEGTLQKGDILVAPFTDPGWTPFFASASGLVTEIGGQMTHGSVIAREYGIPAVVGVEEATKRIRDGQPIRVNGTKGYVELLEEGPPPP